MKPTVKQNFALVGLFVLCMALIVLTGCTSVQTTNDASWTWPKELGR